MKHISVGKSMSAMSVCLLLAAAFVVMAVGPVQGSDAASDYYFSGETMETLSDSNGINETTKSATWNTKDVRGYAIVNEFVYVSYKTGDLSKLDIKTGKEIAKVSTGVTSGNDYITVGEGYVLDPASGKVYNLDLEPLYELGVTSDQAYYDDGFWYIVKRDKTCYCFPSEDGDESSSSNVQTAKWSTGLKFYIDSFTLTVSLAFGDKCLFYPGIGETDTAERVLYSIDKSTGETKDSYVMTEIKGTYWNSGFIQCYDDTVIVTTHWDNMYNPVREGTDYKVMFQVDVGSDGKFVSDSARYLSNGYNDTYGSTMVIIDDLGFAQAGLRFEVFDMESGKVIASTEKDSRLGKTYSNIAVAAGDDGYVRGYVSPAGIPNPLQPVDGLICFEYNTKTKEIRTFDLQVGEAVADNTNPVKIGPNGEVVFAKNDGKLYCITSTQERSGGTTDFTIWILAAVIIVVIIAAAVCLMRYRGRQQA